MFPISFLVVPLTWLTCSGRRAGFSQAVSQRTGTLWRADGLVRQRGRRVWRIKEHRCFWLGCRVYKKENWWRWGWKGKWRSGCVKVCFECYRVFSLTWTACLIGVNNWDDLSLFLFYFWWIHGPSQLHRNLSPLAKLLTPSLVFHLEPADSLGSCSSWLLPACLTSSSSVSPSCTPSPSSPLVPSDTHSPCMAWYRPLLYAPSTWPSPGPNISIGSPCSALPLDSPWPPPGCILSVFQEG